GEEQNMPDYNAETPAPWADCDIETAIIGAKVSSIGNFSFYSNTSLKSVHLQHTDFFITNFATTFGDNTDLCIYVVNSDMFDKVDKAGYTADYLYLITFTTYNGVSTVKYYPNKTKAEDIEAPSLTIKPTPDNESKVYMHYCGVWSPAISDVSGNATYAEVKKQRGCFSENEVTQKVIAPATCMSTGIAREMCICSRINEDEIIVLDIDPNNHTFDDNSEYCLNGCNTKNPSYKPTTTTTTTTTTTATTATATTTTANQTTVNTATTQPQQTTDTATTSTTKPVASATKPNLKKASISKLKKGKKQFTLYWKKLSGVSGYQVQYSTSKKFYKSKTKTVTVKGNKSKKPSKTIKKLKSGKKYYVRVRAYKKVKVNGKTMTYFGDWSKAKSITVK
ncbi:MAG: fibronectin type III domain-containing protein, partial [Eubacterium sp.]